MVVGSNPTIGFGFQALREPKARRLHLNCTSKASQTPLFKGDLAAIDRKSPLSIF